MKIFKMNKLMYPIEVINYVDSYPGYTGFVLDIEYIERSNFFVYFQIDIRNDSNFNEDIFTYNKPVKNFHVYSAYKGQPEINRYVPVGMLDWK
jgi:hypothetical protein